MNHVEYLGGTVSTCRTCGRLLPARIQIRDGAVWFHKHCPEHGPQQVRIYADAEQYRALSHYFRPGSIPLEFATTAQAGCPGSCGLCPNHEQHVCLPILEITDHCDLACPICLVDATGTYHLTPAQVEGILDRLIASEGQVDVLNLSGGEPTLNPQFREIVRTCRARPEIQYVSVSTNGRRLARDPALREFLAEHQVIVSLQYDGCEAGGYQTLRGENLRAEKLQLIAHFGNLRGRMSLTVTVARGVNDQRLGDPLRLLFEQDHILSVMYQPLAYVGRGAARIRPDDAVTIPDIVRALEGAGEGQVRSADFAPLPCSHPACFSQAFYLRTGYQEYFPLRRLLNPERYLDLVQNRALPGNDAQTFSLIQEAVYNLWSGPAGLDGASRKVLNAVHRILASLNACGPECNCAGLSAEQAIKSVFIHHFMDRDTFDLSRARKCCQVYPQADGRLIPACVYNCLQR